DEESSMIWGHDVRTTWKTDGRRRSDRKRITGSPSVARKQSRVPAENGHRTGGRRRDKSAAAVWSRGAGTVRGPARAQRGPGATARGDDLDRGPPDRGRTPSGTRGPQCDGTPGHVRARSAHLRVPVTTTRPSHRRATTHRGRSAHREGARRTGREDGFPPVPRRRRRPVGTGDPVVAAGSPRSGRPGR